MGHCHILTIQDNFSKHCTAVPLKDIKAHTIAHALATNKLFNQLGKVLRFHHIRYRPQSNGALERSHHVLAEYLKTLTDEFTDWDELLPFAMLSYNTTVHSSTNSTPFGVLYGKRAVLPSNVTDEDEPIHTYNDYMVDLINKLQKIHQLAFDHLEKAKLHSKSLYDRNARPIDLKIGQFVYVEKEPKIGKLDQAYTGPYEIVDITEKGNVYLESEDGHHFMKHPNKLKPCAE
ncbi:uncharacterized protein LOC107044459 [Diachasma alloeum]|uniref:uncharacterized protein LOC107044459 n=1 Tax=Diachasma alloeum TaxID=454923 RepID=UPI0007384A84|nr:uncharacterized protein LOC107044459 [Diachasma alloeum]